jgi:hypothetical protein
MAFWNCSKLSAPIFIPGNVRSIERLVFQRSGVKLVGVATCDINLTHESLPVGAECIQVPTECLVKFAGIFGDSVHVDCKVGFEGGTRARLSTLLLAAILMGMIAIVAALACSGTRKRRRKGNPREDEPLITTPRPRFLP